MEAYWIKLGEFVISVLGIWMFSEKTSSHASILPYQNGTMAKDAWLVRKVYWSRERAHDKTGEGVYKFDKMTKIDKATKGL